MRVTLTGASGLIGTQAGAGAHGARRRRHGPVAQPREHDRAPLGVAGRALGPDGGAGARRRRSPAATPSSTSPASPSPSAGPTRRKRAIRESREAGTRNLVAGLRAADPRPAALVSSSAVGYYGPTATSASTRPTPPGDRLPRGVCVAWEREAQRAPRSSACASCACAPASCSTARAARWRQMLTPFKLGVGGPVAGGDQYMPWIHVDDLVGIYLAAIDDAAWTRRRSTPARPSR